MHRVIAELVAECRVHELVLLDEREPLECGATTVAWKWSNVPVVSTTVTSAPGRCALIRVSISSVVGMLSARYQRGSRPLPP